MTKTFSKVTIRPYLEPNVFNMGLEKYGQVLFDGAKQSLEMAAVEEGNTLRYKTGVNPFAPELSLLSDEDREAVIEQIKEIVIQAESKLGGMVIKKDDPEWWNKVVKLKPDNIKFWSSTDMKLLLSNDPHYLEVGKSPTDLLIYMAIKAGGYPEIAKNLSEAKMRAKAPKFFLDELEETASLSTEVSKLRNQAGGLLQQLYEKNINKLMYVCKVIDPSSTQYRKSTPVDIMYQNMDKYISGETVEKDKRQTAKQFIEVANLDPETLKLKALVKDATFYKYLAIKGDGMIYDMESGTAMGKNPSQVVEFLKNPLHEDIWKSLTNKIEKHWKE